MTPGNRRGTRGVTAVFLKLRACYTCRQKRARRVPGRGARGAGSKLVAKVAGLYTLDL